MRNPENICNPNNPRILRYCYTLFSKLSLVIEYTIPRHVIAFLEGFLVLKGELSYKKLVVEYFRELLMDNLSNSRRFIMKINVPRLKISEPEKLWMEKIFSNMISGEQSYVRSIKAELWGQIPTKFDPSTIDERLVYGSIGLTLYGLINIHQDTDLCEKTEKVILCIREKLLKEKMIDKLMVEDIVSATNIDIHEITVIFSLLNPLGNFYSSAYSTTINEKQVYSQLGIDDNVFNEYYTFETIEQLLNNYYEKYLTGKKRLKGMSKFAETVNSLNNFNVDKNYTEEHLNKFNPIFRSKIDQYDSKLCFVIMPFREKWSKGVFDFIYKTVTKMGIQCLRADDLVGPIVTEDIWVKINQSAFVIADVTNKNPNVMYELGIVHTVGKPFILITQDIENIPFDFKHYRHHLYENSLEGMVQLELLPDIIREIYRERYKQILE